jgi:hypothetical protein
VASSLSQYGYWNLSTRLDTYLREIDGARQIYLEMIDARRRTDSQLRDTMDAVEVHKRRRYEEARHSRTESWERTRSLPPEQPAGGPPYAAAYPRMRPQRLSGSTPQGTPRTAAAVLPPTTCHRVCPVEIAAWSYCGEFCIYEAGHGGDHHCPYGHTWKG